VEHCGALQKELSAKARLAALSHQIEALRLIKVRQQGPCSRPPEDSRAEIDFSIALRSENCILQMSSRLDPAQSAPDRGGREIQN
jgi:hypothetical protein